MRQPIGWVPLKTKDAVTGLPSWLYHKDERARKRSDSLCTIHIRPDRPQSAGISPPVRQVRSNNCAGERSLVNGG
jgi:hypothetical protein